MAELQRDDGPDGRTATSTGPHVQHPDRIDGGEGRTLTDAERHELRERWDALQGRFVDDPSGVTRLADDLLGDTRERIERRWQERHRELTDSWRAREDVTTEDLRTTLRRYRDAFEQLLST